MVKPKAVKKKGSARAVSRTDALQVAVKEYEDARRIVEEAGQKKKAAEGTIIHLLEKMDQKSTSFNDGDQIVKVTLVQGHLVRLDEDRLRKAVGADMWRRMTSRMFDKNKFDAMLKAKEIDTSLVADVTTETLRAPYPRITRL